jgi:hypothetical protein
MWMLHSSVNSLEILQYSVKRPKYDSTCQMFILKAFRNLTGLSNNSKIKNQNESILDEAAVCTELHAPGSPVSQHTHDMKSQTWNIMPQNCAICVNSDSQTGASEAGIHTYTTLWQRRFV